MVRTCDVKKYAVIYEIRRVGIVQTHECYAFDKADAIEQWQKIFEPILKKLRFITAYKLADDVIIDTSIFNKEGN